MSNSNFPKPPKLQSPATIVRTGTLTSAGEPSVKLDVSKMTLVEIGLMKTKLLGYISGQFMLDEDTSGKADVLTAGKAGVFTVAAAAQVCGLRSLDVRKWMEDDVEFAEAVDNAMQDFLDLIYSREAMRALELGGNAIDRTHQYRVASKANRAAKVKVSFNEHADSNL